QAELLTGPEDDGIVVLDNREQSARLGVVRRRMGYRGQLSAEWRGKIVRDCVAPAPVYHPRNGPPDHLRRAVSCVAVDSSAYSARAIVVAVSRSSGSSSPSITSSRRRSLIGRIQGPGPRSKSAISALPSSGLSSRAMSACALRFRM